MKFRFGKRQDRTIAELKSLMTAEPLSVEHYSEAMRKKVASRRAIEDALEAARIRRESVLG